MQCGKACLHFPPDLPSDSQPSVFYFSTCLQICPCPFRLEAVASIRFAERASSRQGGGEEYRSGHVVTQIRIGLSTSFVHFKAIGIHPLPSALIRRKSVFGISPDSSNDISIHSRRRPICLAAAATAHSAAAALAVAKLAAVCPGFIAVNCRNICFKLSSSSRPLAATDFWIPPICTSSIGSPTSSQGPWPPLSVCPSPIAQ